jgi:2,3-bisphosphoglycerate-independent phosphoglycerate mutase
MDRDNHWDFTQKAYDLFTKGEGETTDSIIETINGHHMKGENDSSMPPIITSDFSSISANDAIIFFNFREDSMRQIVRAFIEPEFSKFPTQELKNIFVATMTPYLEGSRAEVAFTAPETNNSLAEVLSQHGKTQLHIAETEKYAHVTYFFNGLKNQKFPGETDFFVESFKDNENNPEMKAIELGNRISESIRENIYDFIVVNIANPDVLAHTGNYAATVKGLEAADLAIGLIKTAVLEKEGVLFITADHGNAETLVYSSGEAETKHDDNPVPFQIVTKEFETIKTPETMERETSGAVGMLADVAPTILEVMGIPQPPEMSGKSLLETMRSGLT